MKPKVPRERRVEMVPAKAWLTGDFDDLFNEFRESINSIGLSPFPIYPASLFGPSLIRKAPPTDIEDKGAYYLVTSNLPGFSKEEVEVKVTPYGLEIKAESKMDKEEREKSYIRKEREYSSLKRKLAFPEEVLSRDVKGTMKNGVLELSIPKKEPKEIEMAQPVKIE
jgi:HSP20 family protein